MLEVADFSFEPFDIEMVEPFGIAGGAQERAQNVLVRVTLSDGTVGLGEAAPFPAASGETQASTLLALTQLRPVFGRGLELRRFRSWALPLEEALARAPAARAGVEIAVMDALCRSASISLWHFFGGAEESLTTDITIPTGNTEHAQQGARRAASQGFRTLKVKVGALDIASDVERIKAIVSEAPEAALVIDANAAWSVETTLQFIRELGPLYDKVDALEQPVIAADRAGLVEIERKSHLPVIADESVRSLADFRELVRLGGVSAVNVKTAKLGLVGAHDVLVAAQTSGLSVMVGGMVETELSMSASACLAAGIGGVRWIDLDTPLFMGPRPLRGGFAQRGPRLDVSPIQLGHGVQYV
jgi:L-Ala-D/L-Glu epimerase